MSITINSAKINNWIFRTSTSLTPIKFLSLAEDFSSTPLAEFNPAPPDSAHHWRCEVFRSTRPNYIGNVSLELRDFTGDAVRRLRVFDDHILDIDLIDDTTKAYLLDAPSGVPSSLLPWDEPEHWDYVVNVLKDVIKGDAAPPFLKVHEAFWDCDGCNPHILVADENGDEEKRLL